MYTAKENVDMKDDETAKITFYIPKLLTIAVSNVSNVTIYIYIYTNLIFHQLSFSFLSLQLNDIERIQYDHDEVPVTNQQVDANNSSAISTTSAAAVVVVKMETTRSLLIEKNKDLDKMCRICHGGETKSEKLITPCLCSGSTKYAHEKCLLQWLTIKQSRTCELCLHKIKVNRKGMKPFWKVRFIFNQLAFDKTIQRLRYKKNINEHLYIQSAKLVHGGGRKNASLSPYASLVRKRYLFPSLTNVTKRRNRIVGRIYACNVKASILVSFILVTKFISIWGIINISQV